MTARYRNSWFRSGETRGDPEYYETDARATEHAGCLIFERIKGRVWDVVRDGTCLAQRAGPSGAREAAERITADGWTE
jgi:hypothetical protein